MSKDIEQIYTTVNISEIVDRRVSEFLENLIVCAQLTCGNNASKLTTEATLKILEYANQAIEEQTKEILVKIGTVETIMGNKQCQ